MASEKPSDKEAFKKSKHKGAKILKGIAIGASATIVLVFGGFLAYMRVAYSDFYSKATSEFHIPGIDTGFVPQDLAYSEASGDWLFSGYDEAGYSPIWKISPNGTSASIKIIEANGNVYHGHGGGLAVTEDFSYLTCENGYMILPTKELIEANEGAEVQALAKVEVGLDPAFINAQNGVLYTGVFYYEGPYDTPEKMHLTAPDGTQNHAVMYAYNLDASEKYGVSTKPFAVYSIPDKVQGVALTTSGDFIFSTSWGIVESVLPVYSSANMQAGGKYNVNGEDINLFFMDKTNLVEEIKAPPMMEGIVLHDGKIWLSNESASNKYIFGKLMGGSTVYSIPV